MATRKGEASPLWRRWATGVVIRGKLPVRLIDGPKRKRESSTMADYIDGAEWWKARSFRSVRLLQKAFDQQEVGICLYERTGAMIELGRVPQSSMPPREDGSNRDGYSIALQLVRLGTNRDWDIDLCLAEIGVFIDEIYKGPFP